MIERRHELPCATPGMQAHWLSLHFGLAAEPAHGSAHPKAVIQCSVHADEIPALLVGVHLRRHLQRLEAQGRLVGEVVLIPAANVLGAAQGVLGAHLGRFDLASGVNFNRGYRHLTPGLMEALAGRLGQSRAANTSAIRSACLEQMSAWSAISPAETLKRDLQTLAVDAATVLDLHCDSQALMHLYAPTPWAETALALGRCLGARIALLATESGDDPFDESVARHWWELQEAWTGQHPIELGCFSTTVELRGESDVAHDLAEQDALGLLAFLQTRGHLAAGSVSLPDRHGSDCEALPLEGVDPLTAPCGGIVVFACALGQSVQAGQVVAEIIDPLTASSTEVRCRVDGLFFAHSKTRWAMRGDRIGKVAGAKAIRSGKLLSP